MSATHSGHVAVAACFSLNRSHSAHKSGLKTMAEATRFVFYLPVGLGPSFVSAFFLRRANLGLRAATTNTFLAIFCQTCARFKALNQPMEESIL